jgi:beta-aspartyl-peptidase (threonine type)
MSSYTIVIHGGAGTILREELNPMMEQSYRAALHMALDTGYGILNRGGSAVDAVKAAVVSLEDNELFNAGKGSVFARDGSQEMDACIMDGSNLDAGAVSSVRNIRNPIALAHDVMLRSPHVLLSGIGANEFARITGARTEPDDYFFSSYRFEQWKQLQHTGDIALDHGSKPRDQKFGTVGAVACDAKGNIAAATSTGGMTNKQWGRVGDSCIVGAGTYANNATCAISCTGHGELFMRAVAAYDVSCLMEYKGMGLQQAMDTVVNDKLLKIGGEGGMIGVDAKGNAALIFNSAGMYRGIRTSNDFTDIAIYR